MVVISLQMEEELYRELRLLAERLGKAVPELVQAALLEFLDRQLHRPSSILDVAPHESGALLRPWTRIELQEEMGS